MNVGRETSTNIVGSWSSEITCENPSLEYDRWSFVMMEHHPLNASLARHRVVLTTVANVLVSGAAYTLAVLLRFDFTIPAAYERLFLKTLPAAILIHYAAFYAFKLTRGWWRYVGISDFLNSIKAAVVGALGLGTYVVLFHRAEFYPRSVIFLNAVLIVGLSIGSRLIVRLTRQLPVDRDHGHRKRLLIVGAGDTGEALLREIRQSARMNYQIMAFLDDAPEKRGAYINGVPVWGTVATLADTVKRLRIHEVIVATPSASGAEMRNIIGYCREAGVPFRVMPAMWEVLDGKPGIGSAREVNINDLLRRPPIELDLGAIGRFLRGKRVLVTGAAGSIGSEIARQVLHHQAKTLVCLDHDENAMFYLERALVKAGERGQAAYRLGDITDRAYMESLFAEHRPQVVFHAAAHKHVPVLEANPVEGVRNNLFGTETVATLAGRFGAETFVLISTDKAVNPSSVMGATKRAAELLVRCLPGPTRYTSVRFGNVLGSQGSVVPVLKEQIAAGGPVTITHPEMRRYFMTIPEAVQLVIQASSISKANEIFMLDMGELVKIADLARDLIVLSGLRPEVDIDIVYTGIRPGEKLFEELYLEAENAESTSHSKILVARHKPIDVSMFAAMVDEMRLAVERHDGEEVLGILCRMVPEFAQRERERNAPASPSQPLRVLDLQAGAEG